MDCPRRAVCARAAEDAGLPAGGRFFFTEPAGQYEDELEDEKELLEWCLPGARVWAQHQAAQTAAAARIETNILKYSTCVDTL